jgi:streptogramin lyase
VIGPNRDPDATARWLAQSLPAQPPAAVPLPRMITGRADIREYVLPEPGDLPHDVAIRNGTVLITGMFTGRLYMLDPATGVVATEPTPAPNPRAIEVDANGNVWVVLGSPELVARRSPGGEWRTYNAGFYAHSAALGNDGAVWVNGHFTHDPELIRRIDPQTGTHRDFTVPKHPDFATTPIPYEIRVAPDGAVWMSELLGNRIVRVDPASGETKIWTMPTTLSGPRRLDVDPEGIVWIPEYSANKLARFDPRTETFEEFPLPIETAGPYIARYDRRRNVVWIGTSAADVVFSFNPRTRRFRAYPLPSVDQLVRWGGNGRISLSTTATSRI